MLEMETWNISMEELRDKGGYYTATEICNQPEIWQKVYDKVLSEKDNIEVFTNKILQNGIFMLYLRVQAQVHL